MGLANLDGSMTGTLYLPDDSAPSGDGDVNFNNITTVAQGVAYMKKYYSDAVELMPGMEKMWAENPHSLLATARASHWVFEDNMCLLGDAAHALVPFFGQGMNASFEDVSYINYVLDKFQITPSKGDWGSALKMYQALRIPAGHAISDLAIENAYEMSAKVGEAEFLKRKAVENYVEKHMPTLFRSRYWMITNTQIPYYWAKELGTHLDTVVAELTKSVEYVDGQPIPDLHYARVLIAKHVTPYLAEHGMSEQRYSYFIEK